VKGGGRLLQAALAACALGFAATSARWLSQGLDPVAEAAYRRDVRLLGIVAAQVDEDILRVHSGVVLHYDDLARHLRELRRLLAALSAPPELGFDLGLGHSLRLARITALAASSQHAAERFTSEHAVLRNSRQYFPVLLQELKSRTPPQESGRLDRAVTQLFEALAHFDVITASEAAERLRTGLLELASAAAAQGTEPDRRLELLQRHGRAILQRSAAVDRWLEASLAIPLARDALELYESYAARQRSASLASQRLLTWVAILGLASIALALAELSLRLSRSRAELRRAGTELERANRSLAREREKERELGQLKTRFVSATAHEFKSPLSTILSSSEMLEAYAARWDEERRSSHFRRIRTAALRMTEMLDEVLLIGRAEAGALVPVPEEIELPEFCETLLQGLAHAPGARERVRLDRRGAARVRLDQRLLSHVLGNLLDNALKYSPAESPVVLQLVVSDSQLTCTVEDRGIGIPPADLPDLFVSFQRASNVGTVQGSGLGLAVVQRAVEAQSGTVEVKSELGLGTKFVVRLPLAEPAAGAPQPLLALQNPSSHT
jgi:signal transduction histidine kinase